MKNRLLAIVLALVTVLVCAFNVVACGSPEPASTADDDAYYYLYQAGEYSKYSYIRIRKNGKVVDVVMNGEKASDSAKIFGTTDGENLTITATADNVDEKMIYKGKINDGVIHLTAVEYYVNGALTISPELDLYFCKKGSTPNVDTDDDDDDTDRRHGTDFVMPADGFDTQSPVAITFYHTMGQDLRSILQSYIEQFNVLYPNITVTESSIGSYNDVRDRIITDIKTGTQPDLSFCYPDHVAIYNEVKAVLPLNDFLSDGTYKNVTVTNTAGTEAVGFTAMQQNAFVQTFLSDGYNFGDGSKMYTLPFSKSTEVMYYNKTFFQQNGLSVPTTWDEMETVCARIKTLAPTGTPLGYDSTDNWFINMCEQSNSAYTSSSGDHYLFDNQINRSFVQRFKDWCDSGYCTTRALSDAYTSQLFTEQKCYMSIASSAGAYYYIARQATEDYAFEVGVAPIPQVDKSNPKVILQGPSLCIFQQSNPQKVLASWLFAKFLTTNVSFQAQYSQTANYMPVITTVTEHPVYRDYLAGANGYGNTPARAAQVCFDMMRDNVFFTTPAFDGSSNARDQVGSLMNAVFANEKTIDQAFKYAIEQCEYYEAQR